MKKGLKWNDRLLMDSNGYIYASVTGNGSKIQLIVYREKRLIDLGTFESVEKAKAYAEKAI